MSNLIVPYVNIIPCLWYLSMCGLHNFSRAAWCCLLLVLPLIRFHISFSSVFFQGFLFLVKGSQPQIWSHRLASTRNLLQVCKSSHRHNNISRLWDPGLGNTISPPAVLSTGFLSVINCRKFLRQKNVGHDEGMAPPQLQLRPQSWLREDVLHLVIVHLLLRVHARLAP